MVSAKNIRLEPIGVGDARAVIKRLHYSGKIVNNSQLHIGVFLNGRLEGAMQFGPSLDKRKIIGLVRGTKWNGFLELNRMAFSDKLPKNSESRALSIAFRLIKKSYPFIDWIISFADGTQSGDGTIYRASGFDLIGIKANRTIIKLKSGEIVSATTYTKAKHVLKQNGRAGVPKDSEKLAGFQLRYIYFLNKGARERLTVPVLPFSKIQEIGAGMYLGRPKLGNDADHANSDGATPIRTLQGKAA